MIKELGRKLVSKQGAGLAVIALSMFGLFPASAETFPTVAVLADCDGAKVLPYKNGRVGGGLGNHFDLYLRATNPGNNGRAGYVVDRFNGDLALRNDIVIYLYSDYMEAAKTATRVRFVFANGITTDRLISEFTIKSVNGSNGYYECRYPASKLLESGVPLLRKIALFVDQGPVSVDLGSILLSAENGNWRAISLDPRSSGCSALPAPPK